MKLADMEVKLESARLLTWKAAMLKDAGENFTKVCLIQIHVPSKGYVPFLGWLSRIWSLHILHKEFREMLSRTTNQVNGKLVGPF